LALLKHGEALDNAKYRAATGISNSRAATAELQDLVARELVEQQGDRRQVIDLVSVRGEVSKSEISAALDINPKTVEYWLGRLKREGTIEPTEYGRGNRNTKYRMTPKASQAELFPNAPVDDE